MNIKLSKGLFALIWIGVTDKYWMNWYGKNCYEDEFMVNLKVTALTIIEEIEYLIKSLNQTITEWKIKKL